MSPVKAAPPPINIRAFPMSPVKAPPPIYDDDNDEESSTEESDNTTDSEPILRRASTAGRKPARKPALKPALRGKSFASRQGSAGKPAEELRRRKSLDFTTVHKKSLVSERKAGESEGTASHGVDHSEDGERAARRREMLASFADLQQGYTHTQRIDSKKDRSSLATANDRDKVDVGSLKALPTQMVQKTSPEFDDFGLSDDTKLQEQSQTSSQSKKEVAAAKRSFLESIPSLVPASKLHSAPSEPDNTTEESVLPGKQDASENDFELDNRTRKIEPASSESGAVGKSKLDRLESGKISDSALKKRLDTPPANTDEPVLGKIESEQLQGEDVWENAFEPDFDTGKTETVHLDIEDSEVAAKSAVEIDEYAERRAIGVPASMDVAESNLKSEEEATLADSVKAVEPETKSADYFSGSIASVERSSEMVDLMGTEVEARVDELEVESQLVHALEEINALQALIDEKQRLLTEKAAEAKKLQLCKAKLRQHHNKYDQKGKVGEAQENIRPREHEGFGSDDQFHSCDEFEIGARTGPHAEEQSVHNAQGDNGSRSIAHTDAEGNELDNNHDQVSNRDDDEISVDFHPGNDSLSANRVAGSETSRKTDGRNEVDVGCAFVNERARPTELSPLSERRSSNGDGHSRVCFISRDDMHQRFGITTPPPPPPAVRIRTLDDETTTGKPAEMSASSTHEGEQVSSRPVADEYQISGGGEHLDKIDGFNEMEEVEEEKDNHFPSQDTSTSDRGDLADESSAVDETKNVKIPIYLIFPDEHDRPMADQANQVPEDVEQIEEDTRHSDSSTEVEASREQVKFIEREGSEDSAVLDISDVHPEMSNEIEETEDNVAAQERNMENSDFGSRHEVEVGDVSSQEGGCTWDDQFHSCDEFEVFEDAPVEASFSESKRSWHGSFHNLNMEVEEQSAGESGVSGSPAVETDSEAELQSKDDNRDRRRYPEPIDFGDNSDSFVGEGGLLDRHAGKVESVSQPRDMAAQGKSNRDPDGESSSESSNSSNDGESASHEDENEAYANLSEDSLDSGARILPESLHRRQAATEEAKAEARRLEKERVLAARQRGEQMRKEYERQKEERKAAARARQLDQGRRVADGSIASSRRIEEVRFMAATRIQAVFRGWSTFEFYMIQRDSVSYIQAQVRGRLTRKKFEQSKRERGAEDSRLDQKLQCVDKIEHEVSEVDCGYVEARDNETCEAASTRIQAAFRGWSAAEFFVIQRDAAIDIQSQVRGFQSRKRIYQLKEVKKSEQGAQFAAEKSAAEAKVLEERYTTAATKFQSLYRGRSAAAVFFLQRMAVSKIQALIRGRRSRKQFEQLKEALRMEEERLLAETEIKRLEEHRVWAATRIQAVYR